MSDVVSEQHKEPSLDTLLDAVPRGIMRHWISLLLLALAALGTLAFFVRFVTGEDSPYYTAPVERGNLVPRLSERGQVRGSGEVTVTAAIRGRVTWITGKSDGEVAMGEVLAMFDASEVTSAVAIGRARLAAARTSLAAANVLAGDASSRLARFESVWKRSGGRAPSLNEIEAARTDARRTELAVEVARAEVRAAGLQFKDRQMLLTRAEVRAPISGMLLTRGIQLGQTVAENQPLFTIAAGLAPLNIQVPLASWPGVPIKAGTSAQVRFDALPDTPQSATLTQLERSPPRMVFRIERPDPRVRPGMVATVEINLPERTNVLLVPDAALTFEPVDRQQDQRGARRERIYVLERGDPRRVYVTAGGSDGKRTEVFANGLKPDDRAIIGWRDTRSGSEQSNH